MEDKNSDYSSNCDLDMRHSQSSDFGKYLGVLTIRLGSNVLKKVGILNSNRDIYFPRTLT